MTREEIRKSMTLQDAIQVFRDTNAYGTMDIAKTVILEALEQQANTEQIIKDTIKEYIGKPCDDVTELLLALNKDLCERIRKENMNGL